LVCRLSLNSIQYSQLERNAGDLGVSPLKQPYPHKPLLTRLICLIFNFTNCVGYCVRVVPECTARVYRVTLPCGYFVSATG